VRVNDIDLTVIDKTGIYDYSWHEFALMRGSDGHLYVGWTSGCSCNSFAENLDAIQRVDSWQEAATRALGWAHNEDNYIEAEERQGAMDMVARLMQSSPVHFDPSAVTKNTEA
jgi:hypothetical protein